MLMMIMKNHSASTSHVLERKIDDLDLDSLREMETLGSRLIRELASVLGFENEDLCSLSWVSDNGTSKPGRVYPITEVFFVLGFGLGQCVGPQEDSLLITLGDIDSGLEQWEIEEIKVRGRPMPVEIKHGLPSLSSQVAINTAIEDRQSNHEEDIEDSTTEPEVFRSFPFEDYAWRVYHERLLLRYRV